MVERIYLCVMYKFTLDKILNSYNLKGNLHCTYINIHICIGNIYSEKYEVMKICAPPRK